MTDDGDNVHRGPRCGQSLQVASQRAPVDVQLVLLLHAHANNRIGLIPEGRWRGAAIPDDLGGDTLMHLAFGQRIDQEGVI